MTQVVSSISGLEIYSPSAGFAPTNSGDVSAIASGYQVVSATATQLYAGTAYLTSVNGAPVSASRAGQAANASMATSAYYDGTGRLISALPDSAAVSSIASSYAESAASGKLDTTAQVVSSTAGDGTYVTSINGMGISGQGGGGGTAQVWPTEIKSGDTSFATINTGFQDDSTMRPMLGIGSTGYGRLAIMYIGPTGKSSTYLADAFEFYTGTKKVLRIDPTQISSKNYLLYGPSGSTTYGTLALRGSNSSAYVCIGATNDEHTNYIRPSAISSWWNVYDHVNSASASWGGGGGASLSITGSAGDDTGSYGATSVEFTRYDTAGEPDIRTAILSPDSLWIDYTLDGDEHTSMTLNESMLDFGDSDGDHIVDAYSIDSWNSAVDTVANNSASWGQGGVDSATVSAIASSYAESAVSSKADASALSSYALSSNVSGVIDTVSANSASWAGGGTVSVDSNMSGDGYNTPLGLSPVVKLSAAGSAGYVYIHGGSGSFTVSGNTARFQGTGKNNMNVSFNCDPDKKAALFIGPWVASNHWAGVSAQYTAGNINMYLRASGSGSAGLTLWDSAGSAQMKKSSIPYWDGKLDSSASSSFYTTANESGYVGSAYVDSAVSGKMDTFSAGEGLEFVQSGSDQVLQVEAPVDIVAGPGIVIDNPDGNTLRVSVAQDYNKVLWSGIAATSANVSESIFNFERCRMLIQENDATNTIAECEFEIVQGTTTYDVIALYYGGASNPFQIETAPVTITNDGTTVSIGTVIRRYFPASTGVGGSDSNTGKMTKVVGVHRIAGGN